jgi:hypothetical protein
MKRTQLAQHGLDVATLFTAKFMQHDLNGYVPKMREPTGVSTEGGKQALQHLVLEPKTPGEPVITIGNANLVNKTAKIRNYGCLEAMHQKRFPNKPLILAEMPYKAFFDEMLQFLQKYQLQVEVETRPPDMSSVPPRAAVAPKVASGSSSGSVAGWIAFALLVVGTVVVVWLVYTGRLQLTGAPRKR